jgi:hypothetical protein
MSQKETYTKKILQKWQRSKHLPNISTLHIEEVIFFKKYLTVMVFIIPQIYQVMSDLIY